MEKLLALIDKSVLSELAIETKVDYNAKKLQGEVVFKLLLYCLLTTKESSLRTVASAYESAIFGIFNAAHSKGNIRHSSISERLSTINSNYFQKLYEHCCGVYKDTIGKEDSDQLIRFDSTIVALSGKLLDTGYHLKGGDAHHLRQIKFTIGLGSIPEVAHLYNDQQHNAENAALRDSVLSTQDRCSRVVVFDRGITNRSTYDALCERGIGFVSRLTPTAKHEILSFNALNAPSVNAANAADNVGQQGFLNIEEDVNVQLFGDKGKKARHHLRLIKAHKQDGGKDGRLWFITNIAAEHLSAFEIAALYRRRWDIEVFFKFLKQHLNFSHLMSRSLNGIRVMMYVTMIAAILVLAYRKLNEPNAQSLAGLKRSKQQLAQDSETELIKIIIAACGGNPELMQKILRLNTS